MVEKYLFKINKKRFEDLIKLRGWKYPVTELAKRTGFTKSYISQALNGGITISNEFMLALIKISGNDRNKPEEWGRLFEIVKEPLFISGNNYRKHKGYLSYSPKSLIPIKEAVNKARTLERLNVANPTPAIDFYDDATPKRIQVRRQYKK